MEDNRGEMQPYQHIEYLGTKVMNRGQPVAGGVIDQVHQRALQENIVVSKQSGRSLGRKHQ